MHLEPTPRLAEDRSESISYAQNPVERATKPIRNAMRWLLDDRAGKGRYAPPPPQENTVQSTVMPAPAASAPANKAPTEGAPLAA